MVVEITVAGVRVSGKKSLSTIFNNIISILVSVFTSLVLHGIFKDSPGIDRFSIQYVSLLNLVYLLHKTYVPNVGGQHSLLSCLLIQLLLMHAVPR